ncbi:MAG: hypothetical protein JWQ81_3602 [Amycolatopsis sp.]|jgi:DNA-binding GntR family transcriptional regulator|uniref:GntR family transcriptional regulator n=1 Tax=Amycolatopsis sp. TaxID=37632 RepID=UPI0026071A8E|nr:GntR family transcriptional regulator [Amycolatopsis sp.]MCU1682863.1 hypothetical protein [Amycolatopsis sp.]
MAPTGLNKPTRTTTTQQAYSSVLEAILDGTLPAGAPLRLQDLSESLGMSMMPIREAIRQLESAGVIEVESHRGARVRAVSPHDLEDTYLTRITLEGILCRRAAENFTDQAASDARAALEQQKIQLLSGNISAARDAHKEFHYAIYRAAGSMWMLRSVEPVWNNSERYRAATMNDDDVLTLRRLEHERILEACVRHRPDDAMQALRLHLLSTVQHIDKVVSARLAKLAP